MADTTRKTVSIGRMLQGLGIVLAVGILVGSWYLPTTAQGDPKAPVWKVDPFWPKPLPIVKDAKGIPRQWVTGQVGGNCMDAQNHIFTTNRQWQTGPDITNFPLVIASPPVIEFDQAGNVVNSWGDPTLLPGGGTKTMPRGLHGCFVDYQNNVWITGSSDGVVQKWTHDGKTLLLTIGQKGVCDAGAGAGRAQAAYTPGGPPPPPNANPYPTCGSPGGNASKTLLNEPANLFVDPAPDPVTGRPGSVYIADGYGNHRLVVFDAEGKYLRQWGKAGTGPGEFEGRTGGHPHCAIIGNDGLVYVCDRGNNRIEVFTKTGELKRIINVDPPEHGGQVLTHHGANDFAFSKDKAQSLMYDTDLDSNKIWILARESGHVIGGFGGPGRGAGQFMFPHSTAMDSAGVTLYISETIGGDRTQKFVLSK